MQKAKKPILGYFEAGWFFTFIKRKYNHLILNKVQNSRGPDKKHLLIDVSTIIKKDVGTGIQRVVRSLYLFLLNNCPEGYDVYPIYAKPTKPYCYAKINFLNERRPYTKKAIQIKSGDIYCGLDLCTQIITTHYQELSVWKEKGVSFHFFIHDLLPHLNPQWFDKNSVKFFHQWLKAVMMLSDGVVCSSKVVQKDIIHYWQKNFAFREKPLLSQIIPLGANISASIPSKGLISGAEALFSKWEKSTTILMVGTIEPRKGYAEILSAFEQLWQQEDAPNLVIVGRAGWKTDTLQKRLRGHVEFNQKLFWLEKISDEMLDRIYKNVKGLIFASEAEGFGLPLVEALYYKKPVLVRDIPIFREIAGQSASFFQGNKADELAIEIKSWLHQIKQGLVESKSSIRCWDEVGKDLLKYLSRFTQPGQKPQKTHVN